MFWDLRRPLPRYATAFCEMLAAHVSAVFPITRPSKPAARGGSAKPRERRPAVAAE